MDYQRHERVGKRVVLVALEHIIGYILYIAWILHCPSSSFIVFHIPFESGYTFRFPSLLSNQPPTPPFLYSLGRKAIALLPSSYV